MEEIRKDDVEGSGKLTRREFLKVGAAGLAGVTLGGLSFVERAFAHHPPGSYNPNLPPPKYAVERGARLRLLRWVEFVKGDRELWLANTKKFEEQTGVKVDIEWITWEDVRPKAAMTASVGAGPDIVLGWFDDPHLYPEKLVDVTDLAEYLGKKYGGWYDVMVSYGYSKALKRWIAIPFGAPSACITYRESWVREAGYEKVPGTISEFIKLCKKLKEMGHPTGFALGHAVGDGNTWTHWWLWSFGGRIVEEDDKTVAINRKETWQALDAAKELYETMIPGVASWLDPHNNKAFLAGEISLTNNGISIYYAAKTSPDPKLQELAKDINHVNLPVGPLGRPAELHLLTQAFIFRHTRYPNAAKEYLRFMMEEAQYGPWENAMLGYVTQSLKYYSHLPVWTQDPKHTPYRETTARMLPNSWKGSPGPKSAAAMAEYIVVDMFADALTGGGTPQGAARRAEERLRRIYSGK
ncbi:MAG: substrate-binding domain-containing protein [Armatimonadota bacterium]|nr:substrate-binding domain-containing protein [Armatimonadota bacterium]